MDYLLDTCSFLWLVSDPKRLPKRLLSSLESPTAQLYLSVLSTAEIAHKVRLGRLEVAGTPLEFVRRYRKEYAIADLPLDEVSAAYVHQLPLLHRDPFDRLLVAQAIIRGFPIVTPDEDIRAYPVSTIWS